MLPEIKIASPCSVPWEQMAGDNRIRHCSQCNLNVHNFSEMTSAEIEQLLAASAGQRLCGRLYQRADGTILTRDCPVGVHAHIQRVSRRLSGALAAALSLVFATQACSQPLQGKIPLPPRPPALPSRRRSLLFLTARPARRSPKAQQASPALTVWRTSPLATTKSSFRPRDTLPQPHSSQSSPIKCKT